MAACCSSASAAPESGEDCVRREVREELGAELDSLTFLETVEAPAALEGVPMTMDVFRAELDRPPVAAAEIAAIAWYRPGHPFGGTLAPAVQLSAAVWTRS
jgi:8-oxo-dGTP pyrophosphatase MutT (NUDIX family)